MGSGRGVGALQRLQIDRCGLIEEFLPLGFIEPIPEAENPILAVISEAAECFIQSLRSTALAAHAFCLTPWESRAYSTAHPEPERAPPTACNHSSESGENRLYRKGIRGPGSDFSYLT
jgi:hypothetical protein